jgi:hypothetical protein
VPTTTGIKSTRWCRFTVAHGDSLNRQLLTYSRQTLGKAAYECQLLHTLEQRLVLLSCKQCNGCRRRAVCVVAKKSHLLWLECLSGQCPSRHSVFLTSAIYAKSLTVLICLRGTAQSNSLCQCPAVFVPTIPCSPVRRSRSTFASGMLWNAGDLALLRQWWALTEHRSDQPSKCLLSGWRSPEQPCRKARTGGNKGEICTSHGAACGLCCYPYCR